MLLIFCVLLDLMPLAARKLLGVPDNLVEFVLNRTLTCD